MTTPVVCKMCMPRRTRRMSSWSLNLSWHFGSRVFEGVPSNIHSSTYFLGKNQPYRRSRNISTEKYTAYPIIRSKRLPHCRSNVRTRIVSPLSVPRRRSQAEAVHLTLEALTTTAVSAATGQAGFVSWVQIWAWKLIHQLKVSKH